MKVRIWTLIILLTLNACSMFHNSDKFDRDVWLSNNDVTDTRNPRVRMTKDLLDNYLKPGLHLDSILALLGQPYLEQISNRLPKSLAVPDSLSFVNYSNLKKENEDKAITNFNQWFNDNAQPDTLMLYPVWLVNDRSKLSSHQIQT